MDREALVTVERALAERGLSVSRLCRRADVAESTWQRLKSGNTAGLRAGTTERLRAAFEDMTGAAWPVPAKAA